MRKPEPAPLAAAALSIREVAEFTGFHTDTVRRRIADGTLPAFRIGPRAIRIRREDAEALLRPIPSAKVDAPEDATIVSITTRRTPTAASASRGR